MVEAKEAQSKREAGASLGLPQATALILGSIIGVGIFNLPYSLASIGPISIVAVALTTRVRRSSARHPPDVGR